MIPIETDMTQDTAVQILAERNHVQVTINGTPANFILGEHPQAAENPFVRFTYWNRDLRMEAEPLTGVKMTYRRYVNEILEGHTP